MINKKHFYNYIKDDENLSFGIFSLDNIINNKKESSKILASLFDEDIEPYYIAETFKQLWEIVPKFLIKKYPEIIVLRKFVEQRTNLFSKKNSFLLTTADLEEFYDLFLDYPLKYEYQDIYLFSPYNPLVIVISHHGDIWFVSNDMKYLSNLFEKCNNKLNARITDRKFNEYYANMSKPAHSSD